MIEYSYINACMFTYFHLRPLQNRDHLPWSLCPQPLSGCRSWCALDCRSPSWQWLTWPCRIWATQQWWLGVLPTTPHVTTWHGSFICLLCVGHGLTYLSKPQELHCAELFAGVKTVARGFQSGTYYIMWSLAKSKRSAMKIEFTI